MFHNPPEEQVKIFCIKQPDKISKKDALKLIADSSIYGNLGLFIGAGMSMAILNNEWNPVALSWKQLIYKCAEEFKITLGNDVLTEGLSYPEISTEIAKSLSEKESITYIAAVKRLKEKIADLTCWYPVAEQRIQYGTILEIIDPDWIITTNYDLIIECLLTGKCLSLGPNDQLMSPQNLIPIYHLHGLRTNPDSIIITQEDYISLFRPNQYRQQKLSLSIKESTTLIIGYGLGDVNVLTAVDWTKNVYSNQRINYPHEIIQLLYKENPKQDPYRDRNDILIVEFKDLIKILEEITVIIREETKTNIEKNKGLDYMNQIFKNPLKEHIDMFIDQVDFRKGIINTIANNDVQLISGFLELFSRCIDETWNRAEPYMAFYAYNENLTILLDIIENIELGKLPPALLESVAYNLERLGYYIGETKGQSRAAHATWTARKNKIPKDTIIELKNIARSRNYHRIVKLVEHLG